jgi:hypothetical protein
MSARNGPVNVCSYLKIPPSSVTKTLQDLEGIHVHGPSRSQKDDGTVLHGRLALTSG